MKRVGIFLVFDRNISYIPAHMKPAPDIFLFSTLESYLGAFFMSLREKNPGIYSLRQIAKKLGFASPATLSMVLNQKRSVTYEFISKVLPLLKLNAQAKKYFDLLFEKSIAKTAEQKALIDEKLIWLQKKLDAKTLQSAQYEFLSRWYYSAIFVLTGLKSFRWDSKWIAGELGKGITSEQVDEAIGAMLKLGLLEDKNGKLLQSSGATLKTDDEIKSISIRQYHRHMLGLAQHALLLPLEERDFNGLTLCASPKTFLEIKKRIKSFREEIDLLAETDKENAERIYQVNLQFFPLTRGKL